MPNMPAICQQPGPETGGTLTARISDATISDAACPPATATTLLDQPLAACDKVIAAALGGEEAFNFRPMKTEIAE